MSTMTSTPIQDPDIQGAVIEDQTIDVSATPRIPLARLVRVELRKMANTRSGKWLLIGIGLITLAVIGIFYATADPSDRTFFNFMAATNGPQGLLLPVLGILLVTSEWTQRTALVSFTLTPVRSRVLLAKVIGGLLAGLAAIALTVVVAALATFIAGADNAWAQVGVDDLGKFVLLQATGILQGLAFGLLFLNSSAVARPVGRADAVVPRREPHRRTVGAVCHQLADLGGSAVRVRSGASPQGGGEVTMWNKTRSNKTGSNVTSEVFILLPVGS
jgi:ABC-2 family transporter protein